MNKKSFAIVGAQLQIFIQIHKRSKSGKLLFLRRLSFDRYIVHAIVIQHSSFFCTHSFASHSLCDILVDG